MNDAVDPAFVKPFIVGTQQTLKKQCQLEAKPGLPFTRGKARECDGDIATIIAVNGKSVRGSFAIVFPSITFLRLMNSWLGEKFDKIDKSLEDGAGELINIAFGHAKSELNALGHGLELARPSVVLGAQSSIKHLTDVPVLIVPFVVASIEFQVELALKKVA